jgi:hypothetical protein
MSYSITIEPAGPWLVITFAGGVPGRELVTARAEAASINIDANVTDFLIDFTEVSEFVLAPESVESIHEIDRHRSASLKAGRCAFVAPRDIVEIGATFLAAVSPIRLDYRTFPSRAQAEAWLRGELPTPPPPLHKRRRNG